jgi:molecular chaperone DnaK
VETKNNADQAIYQTEKSLEELKDKVSDEDKAKIEEKMEVLKNIKDSNDMEAIKKATEELTNEFYNVSSKIYQAEAAQNQGAEASDAGAQGPQGDNVVDADFKVEDDKE